MPLKVLISLFQKMIWFMGVRTTLHEILAIKKGVTQQKYNKILRI